MTASPFRRAGAAAVAATICLAFLGGCDGEPRTLRQIEREMAELPGVYLTGESGKRVTAPINQGVFVDKETGELCFPAYSCANPDCPGRTAAGEPALFIHRDPFVQADGGEVVSVPLPPGMSPEAFATSRGTTLVPVCPHCWEQRDLASESPTIKQQHQFWVRPYEPPETQAARARLEAEYQQERKRIYGDSPLEARDG